MAINLTAVPDQIRLGDSIEATLSYDDYKADAGWTATIYFKGTLTDYSKALSADGQDFSLDLTTDDTNNNLNVETIAWQVKVTDGTQVCTADYGTLEGLLNFTTAGASDQRSHAQKTLDALNAVIEGRASSTDNEYTIKDRSLKRMSIDELLKFRNWYEYLVAKEKAKEKDLGTRNIKVKFKRP